jgi:uncharacterized membrane protein YedE/YeeE
MFDFTLLVDRFGDAGSAALIGAVLGLGFGFAAQRSKFCLRSAVSEVSTGQAGSALPVWLCAFGAAILATQYLVATGSIDTTVVRPLAASGSLSGAIVGGLLFGAGMVLARGCSSRHLVLAAGGNLRAVVVFGLFALTALATISGPLAGWGREISGLWRLAPERSDLLANFGTGSVSGMTIGAIVLASAVVVGVISRGGAWKLAGGIAVGLIAAAGWALTTAISTLTFEPTQVESISFTAPAANFASYIGSGGQDILTFDLGFIPAVLIGALIASAAFGEFKLQWFDSFAAAVRYSIGAVLMGFGGVLAIGCAVGNLTTASVMSTTAWVALASIWFGAWLMMKAEQYWRAELTLHSSDKRTDAAAASA